MKIVFFPFSLIVILACSHKKNKSTIRAEDYYLYSKAKEQFDRNSDSAFINFNKAFNYFLSTKDSINCSKALIYQSIIQNYEGDYFGSEETNIEAIKLLENDNSLGLLSIYNELAISRNNLKDYKSALIWYQKALVSSLDSLEKITIQNNIAVTYSKLGEFTKAINILNKLLNQANIDTDEVIKARVIDNLAFTKFLQNPNVIFPKNRNENKYIFKFGKDETKQIYRGSDC